MIKLHATNYKYWLVTGFSLIIFGITFTVYKKGVRRDSKCVTNFKTVSKNLYLELKNEDLINEKYTIPAVQTISSKKKSDQNYLIANLNAKPKSLYNTNQLKNMKTSGTNERTKNNQSKEIYESNELVNLTDKLILLENERNFDEYNHEGTKNIIESNKIANTEVENIKGNVLILNNQTESNSSSYKEEIEVEAENLIGSDLSLKTTSSYQSQESEANKGVFKTMLIFFKNFKFSPDVKNNIVDKIPNSLIFTGENNQLNEGISNEITNFNDNDVTGLKKYFNLDEISMNDECKDEKNLDPKRENSNVTKFFNDTDFNSNIISNIKPEGLVINHEEGKNIKNVLPFNLTNLIWLFVSFTMLYYLNSIAY